MGSQWAHKSSRLKFLESSQKQIFRASIKKSLVPNVPDSKSYFL